MIVYGLDLGMERTGVTVFDNCNPIKISSIETNKKHTHGKRLKHIEDKIIELTNLYPPDIVAIERGFSKFNTSTQVLYRVHGVINKYFHDIEQVYYPPKKIKLMISNGNASKKLIRQVLEHNFPTVKFNNEDESDSFAVALTYLIENKKFKLANKISRNHGQTIKNT